MSVLWQRARYTTSRPATNAPPPQPRAWKAVAPSERITKRPAQLQDDLKLKKTSFIHRMFSLKNEEPQAYQNEPKDPARGIEASMRFVREGVVDPRYRPAARRVTAALCALPIAIYLTYELFQRRFMGREQKQRPIRKPAESELEPETEGAT